MIYRRNFIAAMKRNLFVYKSKTKTLTRTYLNDIGDHVTVFVFLHEDPDTYKEYADIRVQTVEYDHGTADIKVWNEFKRIPYEHVVMQLALVKDMYKWWAA